MTPFWLQSVFLTGPFNLIKELHVANIARRHQKKKLKKINFFLSFLIPPDIYNKKEEL